MSAPRPAFNADRFYQREAERHAELHPNCQAASAALDRYHGDPNETKATETREDEMGITKQVTVTIEEDTRVQGYGILDAGKYTVEMPEHYDPALVGAEDIIHDESMRIVAED